MNNNQISAKLEHLAHVIKGYDSLAVAFSGGVDSTFLLAVSKDILKDKVHAIVAKSPVFSEYEERSALDYVECERIVCHVIEPELMVVTGFVENGKDRCYHCKKALFSMMIQKTESLGLNVLAHGVNVDDLTDYRPGLKAADELGIKSPLADAGFTKDEIRYASLIMGLDTADKPQMACLATRIPYGSPVTLEKLSMIEKAEDVLRNAGCRIWRVRHHGDVARIEVREKDFQLFLEKDLREHVIGRFKELGFLHVALDLEGFSSGSMNRRINPHE